MYKRSIEVYIKQKHFAFNFTGCIDNLCKIHISKTSNKLDRVQVNHKRMRRYMAGIRVITKFDSNWV